MRSIDIHAHIVPDDLIHLRNGEDWHGFTVEADAGGHALVRGPNRYGLHPKYFWFPKQRLAEMDALGVEIHVLSTWSQLYNYDLAVEVCLACCKDCNDYVAQLTRTWPTRFAGLATLPMQDVDAAIDELERCVIELGLKGAMINDHVNGSTLDDPVYRPFWQAAEQLQAFILFHQVENDTIVNARTGRYSLGNSIGNLADRAVTFASLVYGGVMDACPDLRICLAHGGGYTCFGIGRMDRGWRVRPEARVNIQQPPSAYLNQFYYDCLTHSEATLRLIIDSVGADRVILGSDWPYDMGIDSPVAWVSGLQSLTQEEKDAILWKNLEKLLDL